MLSHRVFTVLHLHYVPGESGAIDDLCIHTHPIHNRLQHLAYSAERKRQKKAIDHATAPSSETQQKKGGPARNGFLYNSILHCNAIHTFSLIDSNLFSAREENWIY
jgi:hypothetical protein